MFKRAYYFSKKKKKKTGLLFVHLTLDYKLVFLLILYTICKSHTTFCFSFISNNLIFVILEQLIYRGFQISTLTILEQLKYGAH